MQRYSVPLMLFAGFSMVSVGVSRFKSVQRPPSVLLCQR